MMFQEESGQPEGSWSGYIVYRDLGFSDQLSRMNQGFFRFDQILLLVCFFPDSRLCSCRESQGFSQFPQPLPDLFSTDGRRQIQKGSAQPFGQLTDSVETGGAPCDQQGSGSNPQVIVIGPAPVKAEKFKTRSGNLPGKVALGINRLIISQYTDQAGVREQRTDRPEHGFLELLFRREAGLLHDRIHPASHEIDIRKSFFQSFENPGNVSPHKMMETD